MIIAYYAGSGGHTYVKHLTGHDVQYGHHDLEYIVENKSYQHYPIVLTHCLNYSLLLKKFPLHSDITFLIANPKDCWRRKFIIYSKNHNIQTNDQYDFALNYIKNVIDYYKKYPVEYGNATVFDIETYDEPIFNLLKDNINSASNEVFDTAWTEIFGQ